MTIVSEIDNFKKLLSKAELFVKTHKLRIFAEEGMPMEVVIGKCWLIKKDSIIEVDNFFHIDDSYISFNGAKKEIKKKCVIKLLNMNKSDITFLSKPEQFITGREISSDNSTEVTKFLEIFAKNGFVWYVL